MVSNHKKRTVDEIKLQHRLYWFFILL